MTIAISEEQVEREDGWLIVKRDLYFRPECSGYTGFRDEAGRYTRDFAKQYEDPDHQIIHESEAPEFRKSTYSDLLIEHLIRQRNEARAALEAAALGGAGDAGAVAWRYRYENEDDKWTTWRFSREPVHCDPDMQVEPLYTSPTAAGIAAPPAASADVVRALEAIVALKNDGFAIMEARNIARNTLRALTPPVAGESPAAPSGIESGGGA